MVDLRPARLGPGARGGFTTRTGGLSRGRYDAPDGTGGLNLAFHVEDDEDRVFANRELVDRWADGHVAWMSQRHGDRVRSVRRPPGPGSTSVGSCDGLVGYAGAGAPAVTVAVMVADCVPLLLASADGEHVAAVHVGRQGLVAGIVAAAIDRLAAAGVDLPKVYAALGPSICGRCYELPAEIRDDAAAVVPVAWSRTSWGTPALDVAAGVRAQLAQHGVRRVEQHPACTLEDRAWYSYRRDGRTGRFAGLVQAVS